MKNIIESAWENRSLLKDVKTINAIRSVIKDLDNGVIRVAEPTNKGWKVNTWVKKAVVLYFPIGTGGASKAIIYGLNSMGIKSTNVSRKKKRGTVRYEDLNEEIIKENRIIVNCTPIGTFPKIEESPKIPFEFLTSNHLCYDLIYNPEKTKFLKESEKMGATIVNGKKMLENQANESWKIWNS